MFKIRNLYPVYVLLGALLWSLAGLGIKFIPWHPLAISCVRGGVAAITIAGIRRDWRIKLTRTTIITALCLFFTTVLFMFANKMTTAANAIVLQYTAPSYVILFSIFIRKIKPRLIDCLTVLLTFVGIMMFFLDHLGHGAILGDILALLSGVTFSGIFSLNNLPGANPKDVSLLGCAMSLIFLPVLFTDPAVVSSGPVPWLVAIFLGVFQLGLAHFLFAKGVQRTGAVVSSVICTLEPILNPIWVYLVMRERPGNLSIIGASLVVVTIGIYNIINTKAKISE